MKVNSKTTKGQAKGAAKEKVVVRPKPKKQNDLEKKQQKEVDLHTEDDLLNRDSKPRLSINDLSRMGMHELRNLAADYGLARDDLAPMKNKNLSLLF